MGLLDKIKGLLGSNADKVKEGVEKAGDMIDEKTEGKYADKVDMAQEKVDELLDDQVEGAEGAEDDEA